MHPAALLMLAAITQTSAPKVADGLVPPPQTEAPTVIYGDDDRREAWQVTDPALRRAADAACLVAAAGLIELDEFTLAYDIETTPWTQIDGVPICPGEPFRGQPAFGHCSGFLVAPDLVATAGHCVLPGQPMVVVFGYAIDNPAIGPPQQIAEANIYNVIEIVAQSVGIADYAVFRLDRPVAGIEPVRIRRSGLVPNDTPLVMAGHPAGLPKKIAGNAEVRFNQPARFDFQANLDAYIGNSGSMVLDADTLIAEGLLARGNTDFRVTGGCVESRRLSDSFGSYEQCVKATAFAWAVPRWTFDGEPLGPGTLQGPAGGPFESGVFIYQLSNPTPSPVAWSIDLEGAPMLLPASDTAGVIPSGGTAEVRVRTGNAINRRAPGRVAQRVVLRDLASEGTITFEPAIDIGREVFTWTGSKPIPDNGFTDVWIDIPQGPLGAHPVGGLTAEVDITHTWIGDLIVELTSPSGTVVRLHERTGGASTGLVRTYDDAGSPPAAGLLAAYAGTPMQGRWRLFVSDNSGADVGRINSFTLRIFPDAPPRSAGDVAEPRGVFDVNDIITFVDGFTQRTSSGDVAAPFEVWDVNDIIVFVTAFQGAGGRQ